MQAQSNSAVALVWRTDDALQALAGDIRTHLSPWAADWGLTMSARCVNAWQDADGAAGDTGWQAYLQANESVPLVWVRPNAGACIADSVQDAIFGRPAAMHGTSGPVAAEATDLALRALRTMLARALDAQRGATADGSYLRTPVDTGSHETVELPRSQTQRWSGALRVVVDLLGAGSAQLKFHISAQVLPHSVSTKATHNTQRTALEAVNSAIAARPVRVQALMQQTPMSLGELLALQPGDVIVTPHALTQPLQLVRLADDIDAPAMPLCDAALGMRGTARAVALLSRTNT